jgi:hypothetical protein
MRTFTGKLFDPYCPVSELLDIRDIAHHLSIENRFSGATVYPISVARHSIMVADAVDESHRFAALMHDAAEAYLKDLPAPQKERPEFEFFRLAENRLLHLISARYGFEFPLPEAVHVADLAVREWESRTFLCPAPDAPVPELPGPAETEAEFLAYFERLTK